MYTPSLLLPLSFIKFDPAVAAIQRTCPGNEKHYLEL